MSINRDLADAGVEWPYYIDDEEKAIHFSQDKDCPYSNPQNCPRHYEAVRHVMAYKAWLKYRGVDVDELLASRGVSSEEVGR